EGHGLGYQFSGFNAQVREKIWMMVNNNIEYGDGLAHALGYQFFSLDYDLQKKIINIARTNKEFADGLYHIWTKMISFRELWPFSKYILSLPDELQIELIDVIGMHHTELGQLIEGWIKDEMTKHKVDDDNTKHNNVQKITEIKQQKVFEINEIAQEVQVGE